VKDIRPILRSFLLADSGISAFVSSRIYPIVIPAGVKDPCIVLTRISGPGDYHMGGPSGLINLRVQVDAWAPKSDPATTLANLIKDRLDGYRGEMSDDVDTVFVHGVFVADLREDYDGTAEMYRSGRDYFINHLET